MNKKIVILLPIGIAAACLGLLWFLQGADIVRIKPILCLANCEPITGKSILWQIVGAVTFIGGIVITIIAVRRKKVTKIH